MKTEKILKIVVGLPSNGYIRSETAIALASAITHTPNALFQLEAPIGCYIHLLREHIAEQAVKAGSDYLMFIDSDMVFPPDAINILISRDKPVIGADYNYKYPPKMSVTNIDPTKLKPEYMVEDSRWPGYKFLNPNHKPDKPFEVRAVGTGFMLIKTEVFQKIKKPWFWYDRKDGHFVGEDAWFCDQVKKAGFSVWCDPTIPIEHIGTARY